MTFEISERRNDVEMLVEYCRDLYRNNYYMVGFNNLNYDSHLLHFILDKKDVTNQQIYKFSSNLIKEDPAEHKAPKLKQLDLYKIHHFDNKAKMTSLKILEFNMRMGSIEELPFPPGTVLAEDQIDVVRAYCKHDVKATHLFFERSKEEINFRIDLSNKYKKNMINFNDIRIGKEIFTMALTEAGVRIRGKSYRDQIVVKDIILPYIQFNRPELQKVHEEFKNLVIVNTKNSFDISADLDGFMLDYGTGGLHGSLVETMLVTNEEYIIVNVDFQSYYPNLSIVNRFYPEHLGEKFCDVYKWIFDERRKYPKGSAENAAYKLALNGTYGASNSEYSIFYDPEFTMSITINGQLILSMLVEKLLEVDTLSMVNVNTDGLMVRLKHGMIDTFRQVCSEFEKATGLVLEEDIVERIYLRDVNSYICTLRG
jgi:hypothetical protein